VAPRERSAASPASSTPEPPHPLISPTGNVALDGLAGIVNRAAEPWQDLPNQTPVQKVATVVNGVLGILNMDVPVEMFNMGIGALTSLIPYPALPAAVLGMPHIGTPHTHPHPPSTVPPAPPIPLPSLGPVSVGGCMSVLIGGIPAARAGDLGLAMTCGTFAPPFEIAVGSSSVFIGGSRAARMGDMTKHCGAATPSEFSAIGTGFAAAVGLLNAAAAPNGMAMAMAAAQTAADAAKAAVAALMGTDPGAPPCMGAVMMGVPTVLIGGLPIPPIENFARAFFMKLTKPLADVLHSLIGKTLGPGRAANFFHELVCHTTGHPVDVASGRMLTSAVDLKLPGPLPLTLKRNYATSWSDRDSVLGWGWSHSYDQAVWIEPEGDQGTTRVVYRAEDGREIEFYPADVTNRPDWLQPNEHWDRFNRLTLRMLGKAHYQIVSADGITREFRAVLGRRVTGGMPIVPAGRARWDLARLTLLRDRAGNRISFGYDNAGNLDTIIDSGGRELRLESDRAGHLARILVPHPTSSGFVEHVRYTYSSQGDLTEVHDALGNPFRMAYEGHLLVRETNRIGLSFYFVYEGGGPDARCVKTWGDGGIYARKLIYDTVNHVTISEDSYGHKTIHQMNADNAVVSVTDALGGQTKYVFDGAYRKVSETDAMGAETKWEYDPRGNCTKLTLPDGAEVSVEFNDRNQPVFAVDALKGQWQWGYDGRGLLIVRVDPLDRSVRFVWEPDPQAATVAAFRGRPADAPPPPYRLRAVMDPGAHRTTLTYDPAGNLIAFRAPNGAENRWAHDRLGTCLVATDPQGNRQVREHDGRGRVTRVREPDGNVRQLVYDAEGNVLSARDRQHDVSFTYQGLGRLHARTEAGTTVEFEYDLEERLIGIKNEHGHVYRLERGPTGLVVKETGFDSVTRRYERDLAGRVRELRRQDDRSTTYEYDAVGRVTGVNHWDGGREDYAFDAAGALIQAKNGAGIVTFERDQLGRVTKELAGDDWVESLYDVLGMRVRLRSSRGLDQRIDRNDMGDVVGIRASTRGASEASPGDRRPGGPSGDAVWEARFQRDNIGLELERALPGGIAARWERDSLGRPKTHVLWSASTSTVAWHYTWDVSNRLNQLVDVLKGPTRYEHDALGSLSAATYADGSVDWRVPDAVGNLYRTANRNDRRYGPAGQLLEARNESGGVTRYEYDLDGNLVKKVELDASASARSDGELDGGGTVEAPGRVWSYQWDGAGMLSKVVRPDGDAVEFGYDALGRRLWKRFRDRTTRWIWDGNVPLHEWVERTDEEGVASAPAPETQTAVDEAIARRRQASQAARPAQGPPGDGAPAEAAPPGAIPDRDAGTADRPITWLFDPETFAPLAKLVGDSRCGIVVDHLGTPRAMYDASGVEVWSADIDAYGNLREVKGERGACPFRWPGQYEDPETGLYYNRYRYYDPAAGSYISRDRLKYHASLRFYGYVSDSTRQIDPLGLAGCTVNDTRVGYEANAELHRELFSREGGGSWVMTKDQYESFAMGKPMTGDPSGQFITTKARMDAIFQDSRGDLGHIEHALGFDPGHFADGGGLVRVDVPDNAMSNFRIPSGLERGANDNFRYGGYTSGGQPEAVIHPTPTALTTVTTVAP